MSFQAEKFEVGNSVLVHGKISTVEKVLKNGNFKIAGVDGQWRQGGWKAGDHGYHTPRCEHYTEAVRVREERRRAENGLATAAHDFDRARNSYKHLTLEDVNRLHKVLSLALAKLKGAGK